MNYTEVINSDTVVLVEFFASWCPHCQRMMPIVENVKEQLEGKAKVYQYDIDENQELAGKEDVESIPTFILYVDGKEVWRQSGEMPGATLLNQVEKFANRTTSVGSL